MRSITFLQVEVLRIHWC